MYKNIEISELKRLIGITNIIDIRPNYIYRLGFIPTAKNIPINLLLMNPSNYLDKESIYYIYCEQGISSKKACESLSLKGFRVINILGGYLAYNSQKE